MDRVTMFLVFYPHPAIHPEVHQLFAETVRSQYKTERYRSRKMSVEWCANCRDPDSREPRSSIDRFNMLWQNDVIQNRLVTDWYKDVRQIDAALHSAAAQLSSAMCFGSGGMAAVTVMATMEEIARLVESRAATKSIQKSTARTTSKQALGAQAFYIANIQEKLQLAQEAASEKSSMSTAITKLVDAVINFRRTDTPAPGPATVMRVGNLPGMAAGNLARNAALFGGGGGPAMVQHMSPRPPPGAGGAGSSVNESSK